ncbi:hypothetical protein F5B17DRAFT_409772 [Nemania serpens]|nr:hypothetical protein F5B17DRAFT_409772 [Nemania serpens]
MAMEAAERLEAELELLMAMYPRALSFSPTARELKYLSHSNEESNTGPPAILLLRLPDTYPMRGYPEIISATGRYKEDLRDATKAAFRSIRAPVGEEVLDALLLAFQDLVSSQDNSHQCESTKQSGSEESDAPTNRTIIIWLHHLLNTDKRRLALNPSIADPKISGVTKPGYPGVLIFSGESGVVGSHVLELRNQRWQAFQVRYDTDDDGAPSEIWRFKHGEGIREVASISDVAQSIINPQQREMFLGSIGVK